jgi:hypothetical protein
MFRSLRCLLPSLVLVLMLVPGCAGMREVTALRSVTFDFGGVSDVRFVGIDIGPGADFGKLGAGDVARLAAAVLAKQVPIDFVAHVTATNPRENSVPARVTALDWKLFVENRQALAGNLAEPVTIVPGGDTDVPLAVHLDLLQLQGGGAQALYDLAVAIAGQGTVRKELRLDLVPTVETSMGPMRYPGTLSIHRRVGH